MQKKIKTWKKVAAVVGIGALSIGVLAGCADTGITQEKYDIDLAKAKAEGIASVDVTSDNIGIAEAAYADGAASVDITSDNIGIIDTFLTDNGMSMADIEDFELNGDNLQLVLDHIWENNGNIEYLTDGLKESEVNQIADRIVFTNDIKDLAIKEVKDEGVDELHKETVGEGEDTITLDEDDIEKFKIYSDSDEIEILDIDYEDSDATLKVFAKFWHEDIKYKAEFEIEFRDGEVNGLEVTDIYEWE